MNPAKSIFISRKPINCRFSNLLIKQTFLAATLLVAISFSAIQAAAPQNSELSNSELTSSDFSDSNFSDSDFSASKPLTLSEAIKKTFNNHPSLQTFQYQFKAQQGRITQSELSAKPELELKIEDAIGSGDFSGIDSAQTTLSVSWVLDKSIKERRTAVATKELSVIENERAIKQIDTASQTARYFLIALSHQESTMIANRAINLAKTTVAEIKKRIKVGKTPIAELYRAEAELAKRQLVLVDLKHELVSSLRELAAQWGSLTPSFNSVSGSLMIQPSVINFDALKKQILNNPNLAKFLSVERVKQAELKLAKEESNPMWKFSTGVKRYERTDDFGIVAGISIPFGGSNRNQGRIAEVQAKIFQSQSEAEALRISIETSLFTVYQQLEHSLHLSQMLEKEIIPRLEKALTETRKAYELGKYSYLEWQAVQNDLLDAQAALLDANLAAHLNRNELERLTGSPITSPF